MNNSFEGMPNFDQLPNEEGNNNEEPTNTPEGNPIEDTENNNLNEQESEPGWRKVNKGEIFEPGREFKLNVSTGETYVKEDINETNEQADVTSELENPLDNVDPDTEETFNQEYSDSETSRLATDVTEGWNEFSKVEQKADDVDINKEGTQFYSDNFEDFRNTASSVSDTFEQGDYESAKKMAWDFIASLKNKAGNYFANKTEGWFKEYDQTAAAAEQESDASKKDKLKKLAIDGVDFVPVVGSMKMMAESAAGKTMGGEKLSNFKRFMHGAEGSVFLALDLTGLGVAAEGLKSAKLMSRSSALMRKMGLSEKVYKPVFKFGEFLGKHPNVAKVADKATHYTVKRRKERKVNWATKIPDVIMED